MAADVDDRALEDRVYREAIDHGLDLAIVEGAAIAREEIVDRCTIFEVAFAHSLSSWSGLFGPSRCPVFGTLCRPHGCRTLTRRGGLCGDAVLACLVEQVFEF